MKKKADPYAEVRRDTPPPGYSFGRGKRERWSAERQRERELIDKELEELELDEEEEELFCMFS